MTLIALLITNRIYYIRSVNNVRMTLTRSSISSGGSWPMRFSTSKVPSLQTGTNLFRGKTTFLGFDSSMLINLLLLIYLLKRRLTISSVILWVHWNRCIIIEREQIVQATGVGGTVTDTLHINKITICYWLICENDQSRPIGYAMFSSWNLSSGPSPQQKVAMSAVNLLIFLAIYNTFNKTKTENNTFKFVNTSWHFPTASVSCCESWPQPDYEDNKARLLLHHNKNPKAPKLLQVFYLEVGHQW